MAVLPIEYTRNSKEPVFSFKAFYINYARFHSDKTNVLIHLLFVPIISFTLLGVLEHYFWSIEIEPSKVNQFSFPMKMTHHEPFAPLYDISDGKMRLDFNTTWLSIVAAVYIYCEPIVGFAATVMCMSLFFLAKYFTYLDAASSPAFQPYFGGHLFRIFLGIQVLAWIAQFAGHGLFEKRAPALMTNLLFMLLAPFFVAFEILNLTFGYKQEEKEEFDKIAHADIAFYRKKCGYHPMFEEVKVREE